MSTIEVNKITPVSGGTTVQVGESGDTINIPAGATIANAGTSTGFGDALRPNALPLAYNGNMEVSQRSSSTTGLTNGSSGYHTVDRWKWHENGSSSSVWTMTQETLTSGNAYANGFNNALKIDCTTADASLGGDDTLHIEQRLEKQDLGAFKKGTANAQKFTVAFWVKATKTGTNILELHDQVNDRSVSATYTISTTDTWEHKVVNFPADTTGNFGTGNTTGLILRYYIYAGANYQSSSLQTAWGSANTTKRANGQVNNADSTSNNWHLTGFQLEVGEYTSSTLPPFQHESYGDNKQRCMRYYQNSYKLGNALTSTTGNNAIIVTSWNDGNCGFPNMFPVPMRDEPTVTLRPRGSTTTGQINSNGTDRSATATDVSEKGVSYITVTSGTALTYSGFTFELEAEL